MRTPASAATVRRVLGGASSASNCRQVCVAGFKAHPRRRGRRQRRRSGTAPPRRPPRLRSVGDGARHGDRADHLAGGVEHRHRAGPHREDQDGPGETVVIGDVDDGVAHLRVVDSLPGVAAHVIAGQVDRKRAHVLAGTGIVDDVGDPDQAMARKVSPDQTGPPEPRDRRADATRRSRGRTRPSDRPAPDSKMTSSPVHTARYPPPSTGASGRRRHVSVVGS